MQSLKQQEQARGYQDIIQDPELNVKVRQLIQYMQENKLTPCHAIFAVALTYKQHEEGCPCGNPDMHRVSALDEMAELFLMAYDCAVKPKGNA